MDPDRWYRMQAIFHAALEAAESQRAGVIETACAGDEALARSVTAMVEADARSTLLDGDVGTLARDVFAPNANGGAVATSIGPVIPVSFTATVGERKSNYHTVTIDGLPAELVVRVQTGPAVNGTDLRDATGTIEFGQFKNQIDYQNVGAELNKQVKDKVLANVDPASLTGKKVAAVGAFSLINPSAYIITPVQIGEAK